MDTIAIIPARGDSKGIPRKNIINFCGYPLLAWTVACAQRCPQIKRVYVSTDDAEIASVTRKLGADVIERPAEFSTDTADSESALLHALDHIEANDSKRIDAIVFLQATSPLREPIEIERALKKFEAEALDSLFSAAELEDMLLWCEKTGELSSWNYDYAKRKRRQDASAEGRQFVETGSFYITKPDILRKNHNRLGGRIGLWKVPFWKSFEIDSIEGLALCELLMKVHKLDLAVPKIK